MNLEKIIEDIDVIEKKIGYSFSDKLLLIQAFLHSSIFNFPIEIDINGKKGRLTSNQRLEFLGDGILNYIVSEYVFFKYPTFSEDYLSSFRSLIVNYYTLYKVCVYLDMAKYLVFKYDSLGRNSANIKNYSDIVEALIGAIYVDSGSISEVKNFFHNIILKVFYSNLDEIVENIFDWKGFLQSILQKKGLEVPKYKVVEKNEEGFFIIVYRDNVELSSGFARTKKEAEKRAAMNFIKKLGIIE
ncbi:MAG: ribonuclease III domain-containing protein [Candidatus Calescibacterium sp.]|nr:putative dsRNA-binding protein [Candidatus Calescibacterium sp.]MCX7972599.1 putative dsRNA-binding protein [bacterium]MDW8195766.1 ribonuclease III domain-containing protein [Candidatus Calescibacterium sp.]